MLRSKLPCHMHPSITGQELAFLCSGHAWKDASRRVVMIDTHFAWVFLGAREVYKLKKPLRHGRMDYRTLAQRRRGCLAELSLNRRTAPGIYLGVVPLTRTAIGMMRLGGRGRAIDYLVRMRRLPARWMLDAVLMRRPARPRELAALLAMLGSFFARARRRPRAAAGHIEHLRRTLASTSSKLRTDAPALRSRIDEVDALQRRCLRQLRPELALRAGLLVDGHGDLRPEHLCLQPMAVIDCIEFDAGLRRMDPAEEVAFLALEMARLGRACSASALLHHYCTTLDSHASSALLHFYMSLRAAARAKVSAWHIGDPQFPDPRPWLARTRSYLEDAAWHARIVLRQQPTDWSAGGGPAFRQWRQRPAGRDALHR
ncbi:MAG TPA: hypothetical protein VNQ32_10390 [Steroidobacteraceae bacterium]|nr:hypothetical protein [Steroidobacteraceae bacterium]